MDFYFTSACIWTVFFIVWHLQCQYTIFFSVYTDTCIALCWNIIFLRSMNLCLGAVHIPYIKINIITYEKKISLMAIHIFRVHTVYSEYMVDNNRIILARVDDLYVFRSEKERIYIISTIVFKIFYEKTDSHRSCWVVFFIHSGFREKKSLTNNCIWYKYNGPNGKIKRSEESNKEFSTFNKNIIKHINIRVCFHGINIKKINHFA